MVAFRFSFAVLIALSLTGCGDDDGSDGGRDTGTRDAMDASDARVDSGAEDTIEDASDDPPDARDAEPDAGSPPGLALRSHEPIVLRGDALPALLGLSPGDIVAYRFDAEGYVAIPVQVDQRHLVDLKILRDGRGAIGDEVLAYADPENNAGEDPDATFDADDELALMAKDAGERADDDAPLPRGVASSPRVELTLDDPITGAERGSRTVYLFAREDPALDPAAGADYVALQFRPLTARTEDTSFQTATYVTHFAARWTRDLLQIKDATGAPGVDILDRHRTIFAPGNCLRSEDTFSAGPGGVATQIDGPIRAIRSVLGANSGTYTQREHVFYESVQRTTTFLRVHAIPSIIEMLDLSEDAIGMTYSSSSAPDGVTVDGEPDEVSGPVLSWEAITGAQGTVITTHATETDIPDLVTETYYVDARDPDERQCSGDDSEFGASGNHITSGVPETDPRRARHQHLTSTREALYLRGEQDPADIARDVESLMNPIVVTVRAL